jgi:hypothetical protein
MVKRNRATKACHNQSLHAENECRNILGGPQRCHIKTMLKGCGLHNEIVKATNLANDRSKIIHSRIRHQREKGGETPHIKSFQHGRYTLLI